MVDKRCVPCFAERGGMALFQVGEYVVHPGQGVCMVDEIVHEPQETYLLLPVTSRHHMRISFPVASESRLRSVLSREEAQQLIDEYPRMPLDDFTERNIPLEEEHFKKKIRGGSCRDSMCVVKTFRHRIAGLQARNKKPPVAYERVLKLASDRALTELAVALQETTDDIRSLFDGRDEQDFSAGV